MSTPKSCLPYDPTPPTLAANCDMHPPPAQGLRPAKEIRLLDVGSGVAVAAVAELVVVAPLPQHHLIL